MIKCEDISLSFDRNKIFNHLNIHIYKDEHVSFSGDSGRGKTSLLKLLQGYLIPDEGVISIGGEIINDRNIQKIRQNIIWIPQNVNLPVSNGLDLMKLLNIANNMHKVGDLLHMLGLEIGMLQQDFQKVSGGEKQRIVTAICLSMNKKVVLLDEPTSSLDENSIHLLIKTIKSLNGKTIVSASHNQTWLQSSDKVIRL